VVLRATLTRVRLHSESFVSRGFLCNYHSHHCDSDLVQQYRTQVVQQMAVSAALSAGNSAAAASTAVASAAASSAAVLAGATITVTSTLVSSPGSWIENVQPY
jgi:hypothetical protein